MVMPMFVPTDDERQLVEQMAAVGIPHEQIAAVVRKGIDADTLKKHFKDELREAKIRANARIAGGLYNKAVGGDTASMIFWLKTQAKWRETTHVDLTGNLTLGDLVAQSFGGKEGSDDSTGG